MKRINFELSNELLAAIDRARGALPRNPFIESQLWKIGTIKTAAGRIGIKRPQRPVDGRGGKAREKQGEGK